MTAWQAITNQLQTILAAHNVPWTVAVSPPPGQAGPCVALGGIRFRPGDRSSLAEYPRMEIEITVSGVDAEAAEKTYEIMEELAAAAWTSTRFATISGRVTDFRMERDEGARKELFIATATIEYQVQRLEE